MSKSAGKVYFILYLAVLLELLIIIVERDEAELNLKKEKKALEERNKQIQLIAETIINSMRGSATAVSSTSNQSMILGDEKEADGREFLVRVRVADPVRDSVKNLDLHLLRNEQEVKVVNIALDSTLYPRTRAGQDYIFKYVFKPEYGEGEYKLRFDAKTNQIVGVSQNASPEDTVKIGAVKLTVKQLRDVRDGISENVGLRGYIDSLLTGQYENFTSNIGSNEFVVNVKKKEATVFDQLAIFPQENDFAAFPSLGLPNPIKIEGAESKNVKIDLAEGPGQIVKIDTNWVWQWEPTPADAGQTYTVRLRGNANRSGGAKDLATNTFSVSVKPLAPTSDVFGPKGNKAYTGVPFIINGKHQDLNGTYRIEVYKNGEKLKDASEPQLTLNAGTDRSDLVFMQDEGKTLQTRIFFRSPYMREWITLKDTTMKLQMPPMRTPGSLELNAGEVVTFKGAMGIPPNNYVEIPSNDLQVTSDGYLEQTAKKTGGKGYDFEVRMTQKANAIKDKAGKVVSVTFTDPKTGQSSAMELRIFPKPAATKGGGGPRGGGGGGPRF
ncbi:MAG TPA: hypothetical protein VFH43_11060 [Candidatus Kapabacteria bacterium]|nr:hypothetical protein [Candidatus Kapabacteria bacterium]